MAADKWQRFGWAALVRDHWSSGLGCGVKGGRYGCVSTYTPEMVCPGTRRIERLCHSFYPYARGNAKHNWRDRQSRIIGSP